MGPPSAGRREASGKASTQKGAVQCPPGALSRTTTAWEALPGGLRAAAGCSWSSWLPRPRRLPAWIIAAEKQEARRSALDRQIPQKRESPPECERTLSAAKEQAAALSPPSQSWTIRSRPRGEAGLPGQKKSATAHKDALQAAEHTTNRVSRAETPTAPIRRSWPPFTPPLSSCAPKRRSCPLWISRLCGEQKDALTTQKAALSDLLKPSTPGSPPTPPPSRISAPGCRRCRSWRTDTPG